MTKDVVLELDGDDVRVSNPGKIFYPRIGKTKLDVVNQYLSVAGGALASVRDRPMNLKRFPNGAEREPFCRSVGGRCPQGGAGGQRGVLVDNGLIGFP